ncbi:MAG: cell division protein ZapA [Lachnospiraceae bacterium]|nr:cell division protein ZapA [Lachnospiraceae bacterium]
MRKNYTDVVIDDKVYTVGCEEDSSYMQELAAYVNGKLEDLRSQPGFNKQPYGSRQILILMNIADDYLRMKRKTEETQARYQEQENEFYTMKREMVNMKLQMEQNRLQMEQLKLQNQVLSLGLSGNEEARERLMADVINSVRKEADASGASAAAPASGAVPAAENTSRESAVTSQNFGGDSAQKRTDRHGKRR